MSKQAFEKKLEALQDLGVEDLRKALADKNNFYVGKVARRAASLNATALIEPMLQAFNRFLEGGAEADPQCWAKFDLLESLYELGHRNPSVYRRAFRCIQLENVWGGKEDSATRVRAQAALALIDCELDPIQLLRTLLHGLSDPAKNVRIETIRALTRLGRWEGELLIRQKALSGDPQPEVLGNAFSAVLELEQQGSVQFVIDFLDSDDEATQLEAAASLAQSRHESAFQAISKLWGKILTQDMRRTIVISLGASPLEEARDFLLTILKDGQTEEAIWAVTALATSRHRDDLRQTIQAIIDQRRDRQLAQAFREEFN
jgi:HEAT repeat protein